MGRFGRLAMSLQGKGEGSRQVGDIFSKHGETVMVSRPIGIDLFAGAGGMSLGFEMAGFEIKAAVEIDPIHCATHHFNFPFSTPICTNVSDITGKEIRRRARIENDEIAVVFGGSPCQGFSMIGKRALDDPRNELVFHFLRLVVELKPRYFVFENVPGLTVGNHRKFLAELIDEFESRGYAVRNPYAVLNATEYGVPQNRKRLFLLGTRKGGILPHYPEPDTEPPPTVRQAIGDLPKIERDPLLFERDWTNLPFGKSSVYASRLRGLEPIPGDLSHPRIYDPNIVTSCARAVHTEKSIKRFLETPYGKTEPVSRFFKLDPIGVSNTLRAGTASNRGAFTAPRPIHPFVPRCITVREAARLHSYPDWFRFHTTKWHGFRQVGNSVAPLLAMRVAVAVRVAGGYIVRKPMKAIPVGNPELLTMDMRQASAHFKVDPRIIEPRRRMAVAV